MTRGHKTALFKPYCRLDKGKFSCFQRTINDCNQLNHDCVNASSVNMNKIDNYLTKASYTWVEHLSFLEIVYSYLYFN